MASVDVDIDVKEIDTVIESKFMSEIEDGIVLKSSFKVFRKMQPSITKQLASSHRTLNYSPADCAFSTIILLKILLNSNSSDPYGTLPIFFPPKFLILCTFLAH